MLTFQDLWLSLVMSNHVIIVAAGAGRRFGGPKQFQVVHGRPLFIFAVSVFEAHKAVQTITLVVPKRRIKAAKKAVKNLGFKKVLSVVAGGKRRQDSVVNGLRTLRNKTGVVVIHDAVRPLVSRRMIQRGIHLCRTYKAVIPGIKAYDTVKRCLRHRVEETVPRDDLFLIQTPQFYDLRLIRQAITRADFRIEYTDEATMLESLGVPIRIFQGDRYNIKVTDKKDLRLVEKLLP
jgi:2-C-methyl-D-erythritol 4-phosphate cytidylyltransferase